MVKSAYALGVVLILSGLFISSPALIECLRSQPVDLLEPRIAEQLLLGAGLFRIALITSGFVIVMIGVTQRWALDRRLGAPLSIERNDKHHKVCFVVLVSVLIAATALRLYQLDSGLWIDEIVTYVNYANLSFGRLISTYDSQNHHVLYSLLTHVSFLLFGDSGWALRLPAALLGVASVWALYLFSRQVTTVREALLSAALLTFSYHHIWFSQNARGYTGLLLCTILTSLFLIRGLREGKRNFWIYYAIFASLGTYFHMTMLFIVASHFLIYLWNLMARRGTVWSERWDGLFFGFGLAGLFTFLLYSIVVPQILAGTYLEGVKETIAIWRNPIWTLLELAKGMQIGFTGVIVGIAACVVFGAGVYRFMRTEPLVIQILVFPVVVTIAIMIVLGHPLFPRSFFFTIGFGALIVIHGTLVLTRGVAQWFHFGIKASTQLGTLLCIGLVAVSAISIPRAYAPKQDYFGAISYVERHREQGDAIVTVGVATFPYNKFYKLNVGDVEKLEDLNSVRLHAKRTWLLYTMPLHLQSTYPEIAANINRDFKLMKEFYGTLGDGTVYVWLSDTPPS